MNHLTIDTLRKSRVCYGLNMNSAHLFFVGVVAAFTSVAQAQIQGEVVIAPPGSRPFALSSDCYRATASGFDRKKDIGEFFLLVEATNNLPFVADSNEEADAKIKSGEDGPLGYAFYFTQRKKVGEARSVFLSRTVAAKTAKDSEAQKVFSFTEQGKNVTITLDNSEKNVQLSAEELAVNSDEPVIASSATLKSFHIKLTRTENIQDCLAE